ncbi:MAG: hypothetical protein JNN12_07325 [Bacteroidetes Order II. Incertae sedis bacterium]|nr:hypothetical protein [Bacteroidetes Order II. bacterium]
MGFFDFIRTNHSAPLVQQCLTEMQVMLEIAEEIFTASTAYALDNQALKVDLKARDDEINNREIGIRGRLQEHFHQEPKQDITIGLILMSIVQDAERAGDLGKSIAKMADLAHRNRIGTRVQELRNIRNLIAHMFPQMKQGFIGKDIEVAREVMNQNITVKTLTSQFMRNLANDSEITVNEAVVLAGLARMISRVSAHLSNIMSSVVMPFDQIRRAPSWSEEPE